MIKLIFQPAEEGGNGAEKMVKAGVLENPRVDAVFGYHNRPGYETGAIFAKAGSTMGGNDTFYLTLQGRSGHSAMPHLAVDPIYLGAAVIMQLQGIVSRAKSPLKPALSVLRVLRRAMPITSFPRLPKSSSISAVTARKAAGNYSFFRLK